MHNFFVSKYIPTGKQFLKLSEERQKFWIEFCLLNKNCNIEILKLVVFFHPQGISEECFR